MNRYGAMYGSLNKTSVDVSGFRSIFRLGHVTEYVQSTLAVFPRQVFPAVVFAKKMKRRDIFFSFATRRRLQIKSRSRKFCNSLQKSSRVLRGSTGNGLVLNG